MINGDNQAELISQLLQLEPPEPGPVPIGPTPVAAGAGLVGQISVQPGPATDRRVDR
jgi:hypothetical protein